YPCVRVPVPDALSSLFHLAQMTGRAELFRAYEMVTTNPARAAEVPYGIAEGKPATSVVSDCADASEGFRPAPAARLVARTARGVAETAPARSVVHVAGRPQPV